jgi:hypothetical protein
MTKSQGKAQEGYLEEEKTTNPANGTKMPNQVEW